MIYDRFGQSIYTESDTQPDLHSIAKQLHDAWSKFTYGIPFKGTIVNDKDSDYWDKHYKLLSPEKFEKYGGGCCFDYVEWGDQFLKDHGVKANKYYIWTETPPVWQTHSFLIIDNPNENNVIYVESAFDRISGVHVMKTREEVFTKVLRAIFKDPEIQRRFDKFRYVIFEYTNAHPPYGCTMNQYSTWMSNQNDVQTGWVQKNPEPVQEAKLTTKDRNDLDDNQFGIPELRKYPLTDEKHVLQAVRFFNKAPDEYKEELARNIVNRAKQLNMDWEKWEVLKPYLTEHVQEAYSNGLTNARLIASRIHQQYEKDSKPPTGNQNCMICTWCAEENFRGGTASPRPVYSPRDPVLDINGWDIVIKPNKTPIRNKEDVIKKIMASDDCSRWYIHVKWKGGMGGHEFLLLHLDNDVYVMDAQQGFVQSIHSKEGSKYFDDADYKPSFICRLDNKTFNQALFQKWNDRKSVLQWDDALDIPYMKEHGMLSLEDSVKRIEVPSKEALKLMKQDSELKQYYQTLHEQTNGVILVDALHGEHVGHVFVWNGKSKSNKGFIFNLEVKPKFRRQGYGTMLLNDAVKKYHGKDLLVKKDNTVAIGMYQKYGFEIVQTMHTEDGEMIYMKLPKHVQEGAFQDIKNGVNPFSDKLVFHVSTHKEYDGQVWKPRVPDYLEPYDPTDTGFEDNTTPRICFSSSIEGALNGITVHLNATNPQTFDTMYVYIPEKPYQSYKHKTNKQLVQEKRVYDANVTREVWIMEPVRLKLYGVIKIDQVSKVDRKRTVTTSDGKKGDRSYYTYKWHWSVKPKVIEKSVKRDYSPKSICEELKYDLYRFKYGLILHGKVSTNASEADFKKHWVFHSGQEVDEAGGGNCYDIVEYASGYLSAYGISSNKYYIEFQNKNKHVNGHSICVVKDGNSYIYLESSYKPIVKEMGTMKVFPSLQSIFEYVCDTIIANEKQPLTCTAYDYTNESISYGTPIDDFEKWICNHTKRVYTHKPKSIKEGYSIMNPYRDIQSFLEGHYDTMYQEASNKKDSSSNDDDEIDDDVEKDTKVSDKEDAPTVPDTEISDNVGDDDDVDLSEFGDNGGDDLPNNEYDPKEVETLNGLIASEASALSEYMDAAKNSHVEVLQRLYSDIGDEERFHMEQLLFAKSELTGEKYEPHDPEVKKEYEELLALGMDEESAMATAVDKMGLRVQIEESDGDLNADIESIENDINTMEYAVMNAELVLTIMDQAESNRDQNLINQIQTFTEAFYQEEVVNMNALPKKYTKPTNLFQLLGDIITGILSLIGKLIRKIKFWISQNKYKRDRIRQWISRHGIEGIFSAGPSMYLWDDSIGDINFEPAAFYLDILVSVSKICANDGKLDPKYAQKLYDLKGLVPLAVRSAEYKKPMDTDEMVDRINSTQFLKTKIVIANDQVKYNLTERFFGYTDKTINKFDPNATVDTVVFKSQNLYNMFEYLLDLTQYWAKVANGVIDGYIAMQGDQASINYTNRNLYDRNYSYMRAVTKGFSRLTSCISHDMKVAFQISRTALEETNKKDADPNSRNRPQEANTSGMFVNR